MQKVLRRIAVLSAVAATLGGCSDDLTRPETPAIPELTSARVTAMGQVQVRDVPAVDLEMPLQLPAYFTSNSLLVAMAAAEGGNVAIAFKREGSPRVVRASVRYSTRAAVDAGTIRAGLQMLQARGAEIVYYYETMGVVWARIDPALLPALRNHPLVDYIEPQLRWNIDSGVSTQDLQPSDYRHWGLTMVDAPSVWQAGYEGDGVKIMIIDTGIYRGQNGEGHEDLPLVPIANCSGSAIAGGCTDFDDSTSPWHGTRVLGVFAALKNGIGTVGVAPGIGRVTPSNIYVWKGCSKENGCSSLEVAAGINTASSYGVRVINMSLGTFPSTTLQNAVAQAWNGGRIVMVAAAGNNNSTNPDVIGYPATYPNVVTVAGVNEDKTRYPSSNYGQYIDIAAPACAFTTTGNYDPQGIPSPYGYGTYCSTSMATPYVSGVAALVIQRYPNLTNAQVVQRLYDSAQPAASSGLGHGIVYAPGAVGESAEPPPSPCGQQILC